MALSRRLRFRLILGGIALVDSVSEDRGGCLLMGHSLRLHAPSGKCRRFSHRVPASRG